MHSTPPEQRRDLLRTLGRQAGGLALASSLGLVLGLADPALGDPTQAGDAAAGARSRPVCERSYADLGAFARSRESFDTYHGGLYFLGSGVISMGLDPTTHWTSENGFDREIRQALRGDSVAERRRFDTASDVTLALGLTVIPLSGIAARHLRDRDCIESWDMVGDLVESAGLASLVATAIKQVSGRERPYVDKCEGPPPEDAACSSKDRRRSFVSGHATMAAAGAGVTCSFSIRREAWGSSPAARISPCVLGVGAAVATAVLRVSADRHWGSDVITGFALGAAIGWFDTWGPLDLLRIERRDSAGRVALQGVVVPQVSEGRIGAGLHLVF